MCVGIYIYIYIYIYVYSTVNMVLKVSEKSVFWTSFGCDSFQGNLFSFEKQVVKKRFHLMSHVWRYIIMILLSS